MSEPPILLQREPPVATVVFNRPEARNALNEAMHLALPPDHIERYTYDMARKMATYAPLSLMQSKASVQLCLDNPELCGIAEPAALAAALYDTEDFHAGVQAFLSKQPLPPFHGR